MEDHVVREFRNGLRCRNNIDEDRLTGDDAPQGFLIGLINDLQGSPSQVPSASELGEEVGKLRIAASGRAPPHVNDLRALARKILGKEFKTDINDPRWYRQQSSSLYVAFPFVHCASISLLAELRPTLAGKSHSYHDDWRRNDEAQ
jgi:hypothetical protein